jgi:putative alpha-1,2-mannosidase
MSALGIFAVRPGTPQYAIGTPHFDKEALSASGGKTLRIDAPGHEAGKLFVRAVRIDGKLIDRDYLLHDESAGGGDLNLEMSSSPGRCSF